MLETSTLQQTRKNPQTEIPMRSPAAPTTLLSHHKSLPSAWLWRSSPSRPNRSRNEICIEEQKNYFYLSIPAFFCSFLSYKFREEKKSKRKIIYISDFRFISPPTHAPIPSNFEANTQLFFVFRLPSSLSICIFFLSEAESRGKKTRNLFNVCRPRASFPVPLAASVSSERAKRRKNVIYWWAFIYHLSKKIGMK